MSDVKGEFLLAHSDIIARIAADIGRLSALRPNYTVERLGDDQEPIITQSYAEDAEHRIVADPDVTEHERRAAIDEYYESIHNRANAKLYSLAKTVIASSGLSAEDYDSFRFSYGIYRTAWYDDGLTVNHSRLLGLASVEEADEFSVQLTDEELVRNLTVRVVAGSVHEVEYMVRPAVDLQAESWIEAVGDEMYEAYVYPVSLGNHGSDAELEASLRDIRLTMEWSAIDSLTIDTVVRQVREAAIAHKFAATMNSQFGTDLPDAAFLNETADFLRDRID